MQAHPDTKLPKRPGEINKSGLKRLPPPEPGGIFQIDSVGAGILRDHQYFSDPSRDQSLGFLHYLVDRAAYQIAAKRGNNAKTATVIATFRYLKVGVMIWCQFDALRWNQIEKWVVRGGQILVDGLHYFIFCLGAGDCQQVGKFFT
ncbi:hypothetical protein MnTg03_01276 [bacterium MnTg03]|nr:hypothetical protein MnTg03_01276 [bacterium MnTg03]